MALLLNIDTATEFASVCLSEHGYPIYSLENGEQKEHASFVHKAISSIIDISGKKLTDLEGIAVTSGPGSYTGLRVALATAKGLCYALSKPLITINTLEVMTSAAFEVYSKDNAALYCPMIDARRMDVFAGLYNNLLDNLVAPAIVTLNSSFFDNTMTHQKILFFGSGSAKFKEFNTNPNAVFAEVKHSARNLGTLAEKAFQEKKFADISYSEPSYFKEFYSTVKK